MRWMSVKRVENATIEAESHFQIRVADADRFTIGRFAREFQTSFSHKTADGSIIYIMGEAMLGPSAALPPRVTVGGSGRAGLSHAEVGLVLVASVMQIELCYVKEWVEYHLDHGGPRSTLYLLPQRETPTIAATAVPDAGQERFMREFSVDHPRVHVLCNVSGMPGGCASPQAVPYLHRTSHQELMLRHLVPKRECAAPVPASSIPHVRHAPSMRRL